ncbi:MAG: hypothetical protein HY934_04250 [Candidatus Firestonebacteria bacterium]|nr:hypothetical protein [Candidatus Firestonebacteria bacterium]
MISKYKYYIIIGNIALSFIIVYFAINTIMIQISSRLDNIKKYTVNRIFDSVNKSVEKNFNYYKIIIDRNLFLSPFKEKVVSPPKNITPPPAPPKQEIIPAVPKAAPLKPLNLKLKGTVVGMAEDSFCIIEDTARRVDDFYRINDIIKGTEAKIIDIDRNVVTLKIDDRIEYLTIYDDDKKNLPAIPAKEDKISRTASVKQLMSDQEKSFVVNRAEVLQSMGGDVDQIIEKVMTSVDINPYIESGKFIGYSLNNIESVGDTLTSRGLKNGDIIKEVNGIKLESPEKLFELYQTLYPELQTMSSFQMVLSRNGTDIMLNYTIDH